MKAKIIVVLLALGFASLSGCKDSKVAEQKQNESVEESGKEEDEVQVYRNPTEKELEILEGCNISSDSMKKIKEEGMNLSTQSFVDTAQIMLDYLEEKYGEEFKVVGGEIPGIISGDYMIFAQAVEGEHRGERFEVYYQVDDDGNVYCEDGYFAILKSDEFQQMMQKKADETGEGWKVFAVLSGTYNEKYTKDTILSNLDPSTLRGEVRCAMSPEKTEEEYEKQTEKLEQENSDLSGMGKGISILYCQILKQEEYDKLQTFEDFIDILLRHSEEKPLYRGEKWS
ncbi:hypothetical protein [Roseburia sp. 499]|uniref:hypothetical protein n=1 Tax=Roseburia sp. 499 TaxID=1261634 RepID=UPI000950BD01|nr:hypothetical protein [Roseburia sp. 499]WVK70859.1 hypothetical protein BIV20_04815 [Roseburia sp. 499]